MSGLELCVWLNGLEGQSAELLQNVSTEMTAAEIVDFLKDEQRITPRGVETLKKLHRENWAEKEIERAERGGIFLIPWYSESYPPRLRSIDDPPLLLYVRGALLDFDLSYSVVGTRRCTPYGSKVSERIGLAMAKSGIPVVSGGALGIDGAAHSGALDGGGATAAVLGTGVDVLWPSEHDGLFENILHSKGALISEFPLGTIGRAWRFPRRNRIVAGLSRGLVVVESPLKGGAMITARRAMEMGRELWAVPGRIDEQVCEGSNQLIFEGASPLVNVKDFIDHIGGLGQLELFQPVELSPEERRVLSCLSGQGDLTLDQISRRTSIGAAELMQLTLGLQTRSLIYSSGGGRWRAVPR